MQHIIYTTRYDADDIDPYEYFDEVGVFPTESECWDMAADNNRTWYEEERRWLGRIKVPGTVYAVRSCGSWGERYRSAAVIPSLSDILEDRISSPHEATWYVEDGELCASISHHDGSNHTTYRLVPDEAVLNNLFEARKTTWEEVWQRASLPLGKYVQEVYGWKE